MKYSGDISQEEFERIEKFILGEMGPQESADFERECQADASLQARYEEVRFLILSLEESGFRAQLETLHQGMGQKTQSPQKKRSLWIPLSIAASFTLFVLVGSWLFINRADHHTRLFTAYYQTDPGLVTAMGTDGNYAFDRAMVDYKTGDYASAIERWETLLPSHSENDTLNYFIGTANLALLNAESSIFHLEKVIGLPEGRFTRDAYWYLGLAYLLEGNKDKAISTLEKSGHPQKEQLLEELRAK